MKTAISLPDSLFHAGERTAATLGISRSELYARALAAFVRDHEGDSITRTIDRVVRDGPPRLDPILARMQLASLAADEGGLEEWVDLKKRPRRIAKHG